MLRQLGFTFRGHHRSKPVRLWTQGRARVVVQRATGPGLGADPGRRRASRSPTREASAGRARRLERPSVFRRTLASEQDLPAFRAPDGTEVFLAAVADDDAAWVPEFEGGQEPAGEPLLTGIDHVNLAQPWQNFDEAVLFYSSVLGLESGGSQDVAAPTGLVRSHVVRATMAPSGWLSTWRRSRSTTRTGSRSTSPSRARMPWQPPAPRDPVACARSRSPRTTTTTCAPGSTCPPSAWRRCRSSACCTTATSTATSRTSTPRPSAACSSRSCSAAGGYDGYGARERARPPRCPAPPRDP